MCYLRRIKLWKQLERACLTSLANRASGQQEACCRRRQATEQHNTPHTLERPRADTHQSQTVPNQQTAMLQLFHVFPHTHTTGPGNYWAGTAACTSQNASIHPHDMHVNGSACLCVQQGACSCLGVHAWVPAWHATGPTRIMSMPTPDTWTQASSKHSHPRSSLLVTRKPSRSKG